MINIKDIPKGKVLLCLYNASKYQGNSFLGARLTPLTEDEANELTARSPYFDYLFGKVMKIDLSGDELDPRLYDRDNGQEAAFHALTKAGILVQ